ncbi:MAG TPA: isochorismatase family cysteine hydrolase [Acidimicrobiales bacterium]|jgi:nicotinamidase-related amidase|nr:isochorismatase family cysteine hydrolase [Acidimicrobiales bacterium]
MARDGTEAERRWAKWGGVLGSLKQIELEPARTALVIVDMQYSDAHRDWGIGAKAKRLGAEAEFAYYFDRLDALVVPNIQKMLRVCRATGVEVIYLRIASLVADGRDLNAMQRRSGTLVASVGSKETEILEEIAPLEDELIINKGSSGVFNGTAFDQILRNLGIDNLIFCGVGTNYCVETSVRDAGDRNFNVVMLSDGCAARNAEHERLAAEILDGVYCRMMTTDEAIELIAQKVGATQTA